MIKKHSARIFAAIMLIFGMFSVFFLSRVGRAPYQEESKASASGPIQLHPQNPHYFLYDNQPTILITSAEHYGAVVNLDFDYTVYLNELQSKGLNYTRIFTGVYIEGDGANVEGLGTNNTLAPASGKFIAPWARSNQSGYKGGGNKFDLTQWDSAYFNRLKDFVAKAEQRGIIVEITLFCTMYSDTHWRLSPLHPTNNINSTSNVAYNQVHSTGSNGNLMGYQTALTQKIVNELRDFDNIFYEIINEPYISSVSEAWQTEISKKIVETEAGFSKKHLIAKNISNSGSAVTNLDPRVSIINFHYADPARAIVPNYALNKVIGDDETGFGGTDQSDRRYRREAWDFIISGGGLFNNLDYSFTPTSESGGFRPPANVPGGGSANLRSQLKILADFMKSFDFVKMAPRDSVVRAVRGTGGTVIVKALAEEGRQYALWVRNGTSVSMDLSLPAGSYKAEWINTQTGSVTRTDTVTSNGSALVTLNSPSYTDNDTALRIKSTTIMPPTSTPTAKPSSTPSPTGTPTVQPTIRPGGREVKIVNVPTSASANGLAIDAIVDNGVTFQGETSSAITYDGNWSFDNNAGYQNGQARWTRSSGAAATYFTNSSSIVLHTKFESSTGSFDVFVDGVKLGNYSVNAASPRFDSIVISLVEGPAPTPAKTGDANDDSRVDGLDYVIWLNNYGKQVSGARNGDFNNNGVVDGLDYVLWLNNYGR